VLELNKPFGTVSIEAGNILQDTGRLPLNIRIKDYVPPFECGAVLLPDKYAMKFSMPLVYDGNSISGVLLEESQYKQIKEIEDGLREPYLAYIPDKVIWSIQERNIVLEYQGGHLSIEPRFITTLRSAISYYRSLAKSLSTPISSELYQRYLITGQSMMGLVKKYNDALEANSIKNGNIITIGFNVCYRCGHAKIKGKVVRGRSVLMPSEEYRIVKEDYAESKREGNKASPERKDAWIGIFEAKGYKVQVVSRQYCGC
jgi:hypothetical protein